MRAQRIVTTAGVYDLDLDKGYTPEDVNEALEDGAPLLVTRSLGSYRPTPRQVYLSTSQVVSVECVDRGS